MSPGSTDVAIIGAGPYGLSLATYLRQHGIEHRIFGAPMQTWRNMPATLNLKSLGFATSIPTPQGHPTLPEYCQARGLEDYEPIEMLTFAGYGIAVQQQFVPYVEDTNVANLTRSNDQFAVVLENDERVLARRVVVAVGLTHFHRMPDALAALPADLASHTSQHSDYAPFAGMDVVVVGGGASALEAAVLLHEHGARAQLLVRRGVSWGEGGIREARRSLLQRIQMPSTVLGPGRVSWMLEHVPMLMHYFPTEHRLRFTRTYLGPSAPWWLQDRAKDKFPIHEQTSVLEATVGRDKICLRVRNDGGPERELLADHVIAGTGYEVDVDRVAFIDRDIAGAICRTERAPWLSRHFESSVRGLYFIGPAAAPSFGPLVRFVAGASFAVPVVAGHLARRPSVAAALWQCAGNLRGSVSSGARSAS